jgi:hypothetical protein
VVEDDVEPENDGFREPYNTYRDGKVHVRKKKCTTCIFWPGNRMHLHSGRVKELVEAAKQNGGYIVCHDTLPIVAEHQAVCRGWWDPHRSDSQLMQIAERLGIIKFVD